jgi:hypothetical protein
VVFNDAGADVDFRVESDTVENALFVDGATGNVGIGTESPAQTLHVKTSTSATPITLGVLSNATGLPALSFNGAYASTTMAGIYGNGATASNLYYTAPASQNHFFSIADVTKMTLNSDGNIKLSNNISVGGATPTTSGSGITFPASQSASSDANTLDDYEEGTFTPTLTGGFSSGPTSYAVQTGAYTKIGRVVYFFLDLDSDGATANASTIVIGGLPFTSITPASSGRGGAFVTYQINFDTNTVDSFIVDNNTTEVVVFAPDGNGRLGNAANININGRIVLSGFYLT